MEQERGIVAKKARTSEIGSETQIANVWSEKKQGRIHTQGSRQRNWRSIERKVAVQGCPMDWK